MCESSLIFCMNCLKDAPNSAEADTDFVAIIQMGTLRLRKAQGHSAKK
jgi:hypothetical protein